MIGIEIIIMQM